MTNDTWETGEFDTHVRNLDRVADEMRAAATHASSHQVPSPLIYGLLTSPIVVPPLILVQKSANDLLEAMADANERVRDMIRDTRDDLKGVNQRSEDAGRQLQAEIDAAYDSMLGGLK